jgi:DNA polymerase delta subunit 1
MAEMKVVDVVYETRWERGTKYADLLVFGRCADGGSQCVRVRGFEAWFRVPAGEWTCAELQAHLETYGLEKMTPSGHYNGAYGVAVRVEEDEAYQAYYYDDQPIPMHRVFLTHPGAVAPLRSAIFTGSVAVNDVKMSCDVYDAHIEFVVRFMADTGVRCEMWLRVGAVESVERGKTSCTLPDVVCGVGALEPLPGKADPAPLRLLGFDIEVYAHGDQFPEFDVPGCCIFQIGTDLTELSAEAEEIEKCVFALRETAPIAGLVVHCFETEEELILAFVRYIVETADPDIITGWNIMNFDFKYLINRMMFLGLEDAAFCFSRVRRRRVKNNIKESASRGKGHQEKNDLEVPGRVTFDMLPYVVNGMEKLHSYKLDDVAYHYLGKRKEDVPYREMNALFDAGPAERARIAWYCYVDAALARRLLVKLAAYIAYSEQARVCCVPTTFLFTRGESIKVYAQICEAAVKRGFAVNYRPPSDSEDQDKYKGATVLEPVLGFYQEPVIVHDFKSLYPSIAIAENYSTDTLMKPNDPRIEPMIAAGQAERAPTGAVFVAKDLREGLVPKILESLLAARGAVKRAMATETDAFKKRVLDSRQLALKVAANSAYGALGARVFRLACRPVSENITATGRQMIEDTKRRAEEIGPPGTVVLYGDTDSVFIKLPVTPDYENLDRQDADNRAMLRAFEMADAMNAELNNLFRAPNELEVEKGYLPFIQPSSKKRYAGIMYMMERGALVNVGMKASGFEIVRRDNCALVRNALADALATLMRDRKPEHAIKIAHELVRSLMHTDVMQIPHPADPLACARCAAKIKTCRYACGQDEPCAGDYCATCYATQCTVGGVHEHRLAQVITREDLAISKGYRRPLDKYESMPEHGVVMQTMAKRKKRDPDDAIAAVYQPYFGDRIRYIIVAPCRSHPEVQRRATPKRGSAAQRSLTAKWNKAKVADRAEDPEWARAHGLEPDVVYYIERQVLKPIMRVLRPLVASEAEALKLTCAPMHRISIGKRGVVTSRLSGPVYVALYGNTGLGRAVQGKRGASAALEAERNRVTKCGRGAITEFFGTGDRT